MDIAIDLLQMADQVLERCTSRNAKFWRAWQIHLNLISFCLLFELKSKWMAWWTDLHTLLHGSGYPAACRCMPPWVPAPPAYERTLGYMHKRSARAGTLSWMRSYLWAIVSYLDPCKQFKIIYRMFTKFYWRLQLILPSRRSNTAVRVRQEVTPSHCKSVPRYLAGRARQAPWFRASIAIRHIPITHAQECGGHELRFGSWRDGRTTGQKASYRGHRHAPRRGHYHLAGTRASGLQNGADTNWAIYIFGPAPRHPLGGSRGNSWARMVPGSTFGLARRELLHDVDRCHHQRCMVLAKRLRFSQHIYFTAGSHPTPLGWHAVASAAVSSLPHGKALPWTLVQASQGQAT